MEEDGSDRHHRYQAPLVEWGVHTILTSEFRAYANAAGTQNAGVRRNSVADDTRVRRAKDIRSRLAQRWTCGTKATSRPWSTTPREVLSTTSSRPPDEEAQARSFNARVLSGRLRSAVRTLTNRSGGRRGGDLPRLAGAAGPGGTDAVDLANWLLRFGRESEALREEMAAWTNWLANTSPPWAAYRAVMANRLVALDKQPGTRPLASAKCTVACRRRPLTQAPEPRWLSRPRPLADMTLDEAFAAIADDVGLSSAEASAVLLVDATNGFNELGRKAMLWTVRHRWANGARFSFNCYRHSAQLLLRRRGDDCEIILSREGSLRVTPSLWCSTASR
ncbi:hypothetical protein MHU86_22234 [Fragilaria crotonensis]|nr:hypothetical protein MHU86_22234 [Fragilaria crotonensis]